MKTTKTFKKALPIIFSVMFAMAVLFVAQMSASAAVVGEDIVGIKDSQPVGAGETGIYEGYNYETVEIAEDVYVAYITGYTGKDKHLFIPEEIDGYYVVGITESAFEGNTTIKEVRIPQYCLMIDAYAFLDCTNLEVVDVYWSTDLIHVGYCAFYNTSWYNNDDNWSNDVLYLGKIAIDCKKDVTSIKLLDSTEAIGELAFADCPNLTSINLAELSDFYYIAQGAFMDSPNIKSITIPDSVLSIGSCAMGFTYNQEKDMAEKVPGFKVCGSSYSLAKEYAEYYGFTYECTNPLKFNASSLTLGKGENYNLKPNDTVESYSSSKTSVATVDKNGKITAKGTGSATITAVTEDGRRATCKVTVKNAPSSVSVTPNSVTLGVGESYEIYESTNSGTYANASNLSWSSSNTKVATVTKGSANKATIKAVGTGTANITIKLYNGKTATCKVTVKKAPSSVRVSTDSVTLGVGEIYWISESTNSGTYANASNLVWKSSDTKVATVSKGVANQAAIKAVGTGTADITINLYNGKTATCKVTVKNAPSSVSLTSSSVTLGVGESYLISESTNSGTYANASNLSWGSSNTKVATVTKGSANKATIKAVGTGTANITIKLYNGKTATCKVTVKKAPSSVSITPSSVTLGVGESYGIYESTNSGTYANASNLVWSSSNTKVATVTKGSANKAEIKAVGTGTANITIKLYNGKTATCKVTVKNAPTSVKLSTTSRSLKVGEKFTISESTPNAYANAQGLVWTSSNTDVATVTKGAGNKAEIKAVGVGEATITITTYNGVTENCIINVVPSDV